MTEKKQYKLPLTVGCCPNCLEKLTEGNSLLIKVYCKHNKAGAFMYLKNGVPTGQWELRTPISQEAFDLLIKDIQREAEKLLKAFSEGIDNLTFGRGGHV